MKYFSYFIFLKTKGRMEKKHSTYIVLYNEVYTVAKGTVCECVCYAPPLGIRNANTDAHMLVVVFPLGLKPSPSQRISFMLDTNMVFRCVCLYVFTHIPTLTALSNDSHMAERSWGTPDKEV